MQAQKFIDKKINTVKEKLYGPTMSPAVTKPVEVYTPSPNMPNYLLLNSSYYDTNNYNVLYHEDASYQYWDPQTQYSTYNPYGKFKYGSKSYVPSYMDGILLSRINGVRKSEFMGNDTQLFYFPINDKMGIFDLNYSNFNSKPVEIIGVPNDFCKDPNLSDQEKNEMCKKMSGKLNCQKSDCCVSIGRNQNCVYGDENGPNSDFTKDSSSYDNQDYYFYRDQCYGNCTSSTTGYLNNSDRMMYMLPRPTKLM